jgi:polar amino acid transport system permease protein
VPIGVALAVTFAVARIYGNRPISLLATTIVGIFRGFPAIVTLLIIFFALPELGIFFSPYWSAVLGFVLVTGAYQSEYVRGAIQSIHLGQSLAAQALGMSKLQEIVHIILPQAIRAALPGISNEIIYLVLYSSLASYIGVEEIFAVARSFNSLEFRPIEIFLTAGLIYAAMATVCFVGFKMVENKYRIPGLEVAR